MIQEKKKKREWSTCITYTYVSHETLLPLADAATATATAITDTVEKNNASSAACK